MVLEENYRDEQDFSENLNTIIDDFMYADSVYKMPIDNIKFHNKKLKCDELYKIYKQHYTPDKMAYAPTPMNFHEVNTVVASTEYLNKWLLSKGVELNIISDRNPAHKSIPRIEL